MKIRFLLSCLTVLLAACKPAEEPGAVAPSAAPTAVASPAAKSNKPQVLVANYPLQYFAQRIAGDAVEVRFLAPKDEDPAFWQPDEAAIAAFQSADLILMNGATYSKWADKITLPESKVADTSASFKASLIQVNETTTHSHGPGGEHSHSGTAFTTWIDFKQASLQAKTVRDALIRLVPTAKEAMETNYDSFKDGLDTLDDRMSTLSRRWVNQPLVASHPVYHYLARRYGMSLKALLWEPENVPDDKAMADLNAILAGHRARWMIWEGEPAKESIEKLETVGLKSVVFDPCGNVPESGDFMTVMKANLEALEKAFQ
jgi:zinc transport system substrate-binding protein